MLVHSFKFTQIPEKANHNIDQNNANDKLAIADKVIRGDVRVHKFDHDRNTTDPKMIANYHKVMLH